MIKCYEYQEKSPYLIISHKTVWSIFGFLKVALCVSVLPRADHTRPDRFPIPEPLGHRCPETRLFRKLCLHKYSDEIIVTA